jgi:hypothetical protein
MPKSAIRIPAVYTVLMLLAIAIWPRDGDTIGRTGIGLFLLALGAYLIGRPRQALENMRLLQRSEWGRRSLENITPIWMQIMGAAAVGSGAYQLWLAKAVKA